MTENKTFTSNFGAIMAAVGSAVGLGNIWRFPYVCGKYGGGAFLIVYLIFVFLLGMVIMLSEFIIGLRSQHGPALAFNHLAPQRPRWRLVGLLGIITCFCILSQYFVLSGWTLGYFVQSITGSLSKLGTDAAAISSNFSQFSTSAWASSCYLVIFGIATMAIILCGVQKGIEGVSKVLMPILILLLLVLCVRSLTLPGASKGLQYLFNPDFSKLTGEVAPKTFEQRVNFPLAEHGVNEPPLERKPAERQVRITEDTKRLVFNRPFLFFVHDGETRTIPIVGIFTGLDR